MDWLGAVLDPARPDEGLTGVCPAGVPVEGMRLLAVEFPWPAAPGGRQPPAECYVRGADLTAVYQESPAWPVQVDLVWRPVFPKAQDGILAGIDLLVSVRTPRLDSRPQLVVRSLLPSSAIFRLTQRAASRWEPVTPRSDCSLTFEPATGAGCFVFRLPGTGLSYVEIVHPADFFRDELLCRPGSPGAGLRHPLFPEPLEKGVILRARLRGLFLPAEDDLRFAGEAYAAFAASDPPLGT